MLLKFYLFLCEGFINVFQVSLLYFTCSLLKFVALVIRIYDRFLYKLDISVLLFKTYYGEYPVKCKFHFV